MKKIRVSGEFVTIEGEDFIEIYGEDDMRISWYEETSRQEDWEDFWRRDYLNPELSRGLAEVGLVSERQADGS